MAGMVTDMLIKVDLQCYRCYKKIKKIISHFPEIRDLACDVEKNLVLITVVACSPEKIRDKIICEGRKTVLSVKIVPAKPKEVRENPPVRPLNREDSSDGDDEKIRRERTPPREDDSDTFLSIYDEDEESDDKDDVGNPPSANISEPVHDVSPHGSSRLRIASWQKGELFNFPLFDLFRPQKAQEVRENPPVRPLNREDSSDGDDEKIRRERTPPREDDSDTFLSIYDEDEESDDKDDVGNTLSPYISEPVHNVSPHGSSRLRIASWQKGELLGSGSFGSVYKGITDDKFFFAIKEVSLLDPGSRGEERLSRLQQEISLLNQFDHENIVRYLGSDKDDTNLYLFLELMTEGSLKTLYDKCGLTESQVSTYTRQILDGLKYLHDQKVVHRDIKCANILVDANGSVKLADFGLAKAIEMNSAKTSIGSGYWTAPEVVDQKRRSSQLNGSYGLEADIWSLGCTVLEMLTCQYPYHPLEPQQAMFKSGQGEPPQVPDSLSIEARDLILRCLQVDPNDRPTAAELLDHPFVRN